MDFFLYVRVAQYRSIAVAQGGGALGRGFYLVGFLMGFWMGV